METKSMMMLKNPQPPKATKERMKAKIKVKRGEVMKIKIDIILTPTPNKLMNKVMKTAKKVIQAKRKSSEKQAAIMPAKKNKRESSSSPPAADVEESDWNGNEAIEGVLAEIHHADSEEKSEAEIDESIQKTTQANTALGNSVSLRPQPGAAKSAPSAKKDEDQLGALRATSKGTMCVQCNKKSKYLATHNCQSCNTTPLCISSAKFECSNPR